jgi:hypothetical protein
MIDERAQVGAEQDLDDYADGVGLEPEPEDDINPEDDDDLGEWSDAEEATPGILHRDGSEAESQPVVQPVTEAEVPMPMPAKVSKPKHNTGSHSSHVRAAKKGAKKAKQKKSAKSAKKPKKH